MSKSSVKLKAGRGTPAETREEYDHWIETEYDVVTDWEFGPAPNLSGVLSYRITYVAVPTPWAEHPIGCWKVFGDLPISCSMEKQEKLMKLLQSKMALDLNVTRMFGHEEALYFCPAGSVC